ncbi:hypothetical protein LWI29_037437 [Acer saccharum]|uniref:Uncharacterized protein n=1 Tax=Acer saccharum TaxID=4024 RepID=A0AA39SJA7_ACESA|nr:hypothetical protein LWI29_037437 [Acer saccharum]
MRYFRSGGAVPDPVRGPDLEGLLEDGDVRGRFSDYRLGLMNRKNSKIRGRRRSKDFCTSASNALIKGFYPRNVVRYVIN